MFWEQLSLINKVLVMQVMAVAFVSVVFALIYGGTYALNPLIGGVVAFIPNVYFALRIMRAKGQNAKKIVNSFYAGESGKLILTAALFMLVFQLPQIKLLPLLAGYVAVLSIFWVALLLRD